MAPASTMFAACESVADAGSTGVSVDAQGRPVIVFAVCAGYIDAALVFRDREAADPGSEDPEVGVAEWHADSRVTHGADPDAVLNTAQPSAIWSPTTAAEPFRPGVEYTAFGGASDNRWATGHVSFTLERLASLKPGQVLRQRGVVGEEGDLNFVDTVQSEEEFRAETCGH